MRENVINLEVVLPDGKIIQTAGSSRTKKTSAGYNLTNLFVVYFQFINYSKGLNPFNGKKNYYLGFRRNTWNCHQFLFFFFFFFFFSFFFFFFFFFSLFSFQEV